MADLVNGTRELLEKTGRSPKTANSYLSHIRRLIKTFGDRADSLTTDELKKYLEGLVDEGKSLSYINQAQSAIRFLYTKYLEKENPLPGPGIVSKKVPLHGIFNREQVYNILQNVGELKYRLALMLVYSSGLRVGETSYLRTANIDMDNRVIHVNNKEGEPIRDTILSEASVDVLNRYLNARTDDSPYLFPGRGKSNYVSARTIQRAFTEALLQAGIEEHATLGWLRHSFAVHLLEDGIDRKLVQNLLGISTPSMITPYLKLAKKRSPLRVMSPIDRFYDPEQ
ncbi:MAG: tyrosine-type recombinase/integrase [Candidatus Fermentibacterota bacterium]